MWDQIGGGVVLVCLIIWLIIDLIKEGKGNS